MRFLTYKRVTQYEEKWLEQFLNIYYKEKNRHILKNRSITSHPEEVSNKAVASVWNPYSHVSSKWAQYYWSINGIASPYYIPTDLWFSRICRKLNSLDRFGWPQLQDKNYLDMVFDSVKCPQVVCRNISGQFLDADYRRIDRDKAVSLCYGQDELIIKPSISSKGGRGIEFLTKVESIDDVRALLNKNEGDYVVQKVLHQHKAMADLNPDSINSVRVQTLLWKGKVYILSSLVRIGVKGCRIDNPHTSDGVSCVLTPEGKMINTAYDREWRPHSVLPNGQSPEGFTVPFYDRIIETVTELQYRVPHSRLVGWDMSISEEGEPILIEANLDYPEIYFHQLGIGPLIKDDVLFKEVMDFVFA